MKKILFMMKFLKGGGAEKVLLNILNNIDYKKYDVSLFLVFNEGIYFDKIPKNVKLFYIFEKETDENNKLIINDSKYIYKKYIKEKYDVEIAFLEGVCTKIIANSTQKSKKIAWVHVDLLNCHYTSFLYGSIKEEENNYNKFDQIIFVSKHVQKTFYQLFPSLESKGKVIYNPIDIKSIKNLSTKFKVQYSKTTFITIGRLTNQKGFDRLINAVSRLSKENFNFQVIILGEGPLYHQLHQQIHLLNLDDYVFLEGFKPNPYPYMLAASAFISSSRSEGLALVLCEALILKKTIIATDCSGVKEALDNGKNGYIVENSEEGIYYGLKKYLFENFEYNIPENVLSKFNLKNKLKEIDLVLNDTHQNLGSK